MKTFVLCRHAKADWPENTPDIDRPLKARGIKDAQFLGNWLAMNEFVPDLIVSSPANRAISTAKIVASAIGYISAIQVERSIYYEGVSSLINLIAELDEEVETVMIFGHNTTMEQTIRYFMQAQAPFELPTGGMACFELRGMSWKQLETQHAYLRWLQIPRLKRKGE